jgi:hypothetical protein
MGNVTRHGLIQKTVHYRLDWHTHTERSQLDNKENTWKHDYFFPFSLIVGAFHVGGTWSKVTITKSLWFNWTEKTAHCRLDGRCVHGKFDKGTHG